MVPSPDFLIFDPGPNNHLDPKKQPSRTKRNYSFHQKLKGYRTLIITYLDISIAIFDFGYLQRVNWGQRWTKKVRLLVHPISVDNHFIQNASNGICIWEIIWNTCGQNFTSSWCCLPAFLPQKTQNGPIWVLNKNNVVASSR